MAQRVMGGGSPLRSGAAFNALRSELAAPAPSPIVTTLRTPEPAPIPAPVAAPAAVIQAPAPVTAPTPIAAPVAARTAPNSAASARRFSDFLAVNPQFGGGTAADLIAGYQQWIGRESPFTVPTASTDQASAPNLAGAFGSALPVAPQSANNLQNFYETHGFYPGQGGQ